MQPEQQNKYQLIGSAIGVVLPVLQIFLNFIPDNSRKILLINDYFLFVSIFAALISYIFILALKNVPYFEIAINKKADKKYKNFLALQDPKIYKEEEIKKNLKKEPFVPPPFKISLNNIAYTVFIPIMVISFLSFFGTGLSAGTYFSKTVWAILIQSVAYVAIIATATLSLATYYIKDDNERKWKEQEANLYNRVIGLAVKASAFPELPTIHFVAQISVNFMTLYTIVVVNGIFYRITSDNQARRIIEVERFNSYGDLLSAGGVGDA